MASAAGPIADLSYRNYDGPLHDVGYRWWVIAKMFMRLAIKPRVFWGLAFLSCYGYGILSIIFYFLDTFSDSGSAFTRRGFNIMDSIVWKEQIYVGFSLSQLWLFALTLLIGAGVIAADNRANALLVYLSKPCSKFDYLFGKWLGMFLLILMVTAAPTLFFLGFNWLSYRQYGSWDSWLFFKTVAIVVIPAMFHASIMLGISSLFNQARLAGATYAGIFFLSSFFTKIIDVMRIVGNRGPTAALDQMSYLSVDGIINGLAKRILDTSGTTPFNIRGAGRMQNQEALVPPPNGLLFTVVFLVVSGIFLWIAWKKVRAVEVVGS